ncbi:MAG: competence protein ComEA helix-hairpin-helix repeat protein [Deltaproteobacteria bacterium]|nr:competence protein ComEA helix-hairpin-helix repeat protein [Deltaproteobacteria bacterium]
MGKLLLAFAMWFALSGLAMAAVNINTATKEELTSIKGIGEKRAQDIIDYRTKNGNFKSVDDLEKVPGIGPGLMNGKTVIDQPAEKGAKSKASDSGKSTKSSESKKSETAKTDSPKGDAMKAERAKEKAAEKSKAEEKK